VKHRQGMRLRAAQILNDKFKGADQLYTSHQTPKPRPRSIIEIPIPPD
jgi:hypothetical protein